jgi:peptidoglycan hydrolase-like protein with peptidoglycan-binding domain
MSKDSPCSPYNGPVSGFFGPLTQSGVESYQSKNKLPASGFVGPMTRIALNGSEAVVMSEADRATLIAKLQEQVKVLIEKINAILAERAKSTVAQI